MTQQEWDAFSQFRENFKNQISQWNQFASQLIPLQKSAANKDTPNYPIENPIVYNTALDEITQEDSIKLIVIGDNPGKDEQLNKNLKYLVGQAGKIANGFFIRNPELQIDFRKNAIILNKTPIHTAKTNHLKYLNKFGSEQIQNLINDSQLWMAEQTAKLHSQLNAQLWLVGYSELKEKKIFTPYRNKLKETYLSLENTNPWDNVFVFQHFSMNRFSIDLNNFQKQNQSLSLQEAIKAIGILHKNEIFM